MGSRKRGIVSSDIPISDVRHEHCFQFTHNGAIYRRDLRGDTIGRHPRFGYRLYDLNLGDDVQMTPAGRILHVTRDISVTPVDTANVSD